MVTLAISHHFPKRLELAWRKCNFKRLIPHFHSQEKKFLMAYLSTPLGINLDMLTLHNSYNHSTITSSFSSSFDDLFGRFDTPKRMSLAMVTYPLSTHTVAKLNFLSIKYFTKKWMDKLLSKVQFLDEDWNIASVCSIYKVYLVTVICSLQIPHDGIVEED